MTSTPRLDRLRASLEEPLLVSNPVNVRYLVGFKSSNAALLVEDERVRLFTDFRYVTAARDVAGVDFVETKRDLIGDLASRLSGRIGFESAFVTYAAYEKLRAGGLDLDPRPGAVESLRAVKDEEELDAIRRACAITDRVYERLASEAFVGRTERDIAWTLEQLFHDEGSSAAFESVVASGPNAAKPHGRATDREIGRGETVVIDAGCVVDGYVSDYTRTFATGPLPDELREAYGVCLDAQAAALEAIRAGLSGVDADRAARDVVEATQFASRFGHGLGHGTGLEIHESPRMSQESNDVLAQGNVVTVEPGIYLEGVGGIRIEDDVVVTDGGIDNLTNLRKDLIEVG
jgi:Xaa-Pro aminopeptidase